MIKLNPPWVFIKATLSNRKKVIIVFVPGNSGDWSWILCSRESLASEKVTKLTWACGCGEVYKAYIYDAEDEQFASGHLSIFIHFVPIVVN